MWIVDDVAYSGADDAAKAVRRGSRVRVPTCGPARDVAKVFRALRDTMSGTKFDNHQKYLTMLRHWADRRSM